MVRAAFLVLTMVALAACDDTSPAGGRGYFDPAPPAPVLQERRTVPVPEAQPRDPFAGAAPVPGDPNAELARDVTNTLAATRPTEPGATPGAVPGPDEIGLNPNDDSINLNLTSQEVQKRQREAAERRRQAAQQQLVVVQPEPVPQQDINANVVKFARESTNPVGTKIYNRRAFRSRSQSAAVCRRFDSADEAQRQFLANGGPTNDRFNLDPDGDGFACGFDPEKYRKLNF